MFAVGSLFNHSCEPNVDVVWPLNSAVVVRWNGGCALGRGMAGHASLTSAVGRWDGQGVALRTLTRGAGLPRWAQAFRAARDIDAGEELRITYTDSHLPLRARRERLQFAYGFTCACALCLEQEELDREAQGRAK